MTFNLEKHDFIELCNLLKILGLCESGGAAKAVISAGNVKVDGKVELRKTCKIYAGSVVEFQSEKIEVTN